MPSATDSDTTNVTTAAANTDASVAVGDSLRRTGAACASRRDTADADASAAPLASANSASLAESTGTWMRCSSADTTPATSPEPSTKTASGAKPSISVSAASATRSAVTPSGVTAAMTDAPGSATHTTSRSQPAISAMPQASASAASTSETAMMFSTPRSARACHTALAVCSASVVQVSADGVHGARCRPVQQRTQ